LTLDLKAYAARDLTADEREQLFHHADFFISPGDDYCTIQDHSEFIDKILQMNVHRIENELTRKAKVLTNSENVKSWGPRIHNGVQSWVGLHPRQLLTPYAELLKLCGILKPPPQSHIIDLGAAYGRMGLVLDRVAPETRFTGYEYVPGRVVEGNRIFDRFKCNQAKLIEQDLAAHDFILPVADCYMMYDYGKIDHIRRTLKQLEDIGNSHKIKVVGRGSGCMSVIDHSHPWLSQIFRPYRDENFAIYSNYE
jgi:hypothetical protein